jgi:hypothetical protein
MRWLVALALLVGAASCAEDCTGARSNCCKVCTTGKPCGDACIEAGDTCHQPPGCACAR